jgi:hypothetical protein
MDGAPVKYGETVDFEGSATGGTSPYTYEWFSDVDGLLGVGPSISTTLSDSQREGQILNHTVTLRVTDETG